jgi:internalin A
MLLAGCGKPPAEPERGDSSWNPVPASEDASANYENRMVTAAEMRQLLGANELARFERSGRNFVAASLRESGATTLEPLRGHPLKVLDISSTEIADLSPLEGMPLETLDASLTKVADISPLAESKRLKQLFLEGAAVSDISPLKDLNLEVVWLHGCPVSDLSPLAGKRIEQLNLCNTEIRDLETIAGMQLGTLWLRETEIRDLTPIAGLKLVSLDVQGCPVSDLSPLAEMTTLQRLNIAETDISDLRPLAGLELQRLIFSPETIREGMEVLREMSSLQGLDTSFDGVEKAMSPAEFWELYERGEWSSEEGK